VELKADRFIQTSYLMRGRAIPLLSLDAVRSLSPTQ
jgi:hypothetical protein